MSIVDIVIVADEIIVQQVFLHPTIVMDIVHTINSTTIVDDIGLLITRSHRHVLLSIYS